MFSITTNMFYNIDKVVKMIKKKTQKCQPPVRDTPGTLQGPHPTVLGVGVPDGGLARPIKKSTE